MQGKEETSLCKGEAKESCSPYGSQEVERKERKGLRTRYIPQSTVTDSHNEAPLLFIPSAVNSSVHYPSIQLMTP
jgi:hypothetical protein